MYLVELGDDGLVKEDLSNDGWKAIKAFRDVVDKYGIKGMTIIALAIDYSSPLSYYNESDRYIRSVEEILESRDALPKNDLINAAMEKYDELQFNPDLEHHRLVQSYKIRVLERIKAAMSDETENGEKEVDRLNRILKNQEVANKEFYAKFNKADIVLKNGVTTNGYSLSRIERDLKLKKNSKFANEGKNFKNPKKLKL